MIRKNKTPNRCGAFKQQSTQVASFVPK